MNKRFAVPGVDAQSVLGAAAPALLLAKAEPLFELEMAARGGADMDAVHDMRVASRRLREAMRLLAPLYPQRAFRTWYRRVRRITRALGPVRDSDVFIDEFSRLGSDLREGGQLAVAFFIGFRTGQRVHELDVLNRELSQLDLEQSRTSFFKFAHSLDASADAGRPFADFAHAAVAERGAVVFGAQPAALDEASVPEQHALRIDYKRLRYAVEAFAPCYGDDFDDLHKTLTAFQDALGDLHDTHVFLELLGDPERVAAAGCAGVTADDIAELVAVLESRAHTEYLRFVALAEEHPAERLLPALLLPLARSPRVPEAPAPDAYVAAPAAEPWPDPVLSPYDEVRVVSPVVVGDEPWERDRTDRPPELLIEPPDQGSGLL